MKCAINIFWMLLTVLIISSCITKSLKTLKADRFARIDSLLWAQSEFQANTGIAVGIVQNNEVIYNKGFGYSNLATNDTVTSQTLFHLGSIPKSFDAVALMQVVEQGKVDLDSLVIKYIPELKFKDARYKKITVRQLATHSSGIYTNRTHDWDKPRTEDDALDEFVKSLDYEELRFEPGEKFSYSDFNYDIIGDMIYRVTGIPFEDYMKRFVLNPSGMIASTFYLPDSSLLARPYIDNYQDCHISRGLLYPVNREHAPSGTLFSNSTEMCNWMIMNLNRGNFGNNTVLKDSAYKVMWNPAYKTGWGSYFYDYMGLGWFIGTYNGRTTYLHSGVDHGYRAIFCLVPEDEYGVVILSNYKETAVHYLLDRVLSSLYAVDKTDPNFNLPGKDEFVNIIGIYQDKEENIAEIFQEGDLLYFRFAGLTCCLSSLREGNILAGQYGSGSGAAFYYDQANVFVSKVMDKDGKENYSVSLGRMVFERKQGIDH